MKQHRIIARLAEEPRAVELEIVAPIGTPTVAPFERALAATGAKALGTVIYKTTSHVVLVANLVDESGAALDSSRIGIVVEAIRRHLTVQTERAAWAA